MPEHRSFVDARLTVVFRVETERGREVFHPDLPRRPEIETLPAGLLGTREAFQVCVETLIEDGLLPAWN
jgi:hypothetical protein